MVSRLRVAGGGAGGGGLRAAACGRGGDVGMLAITARNGLANALLAAPHVAVAVYVCITPESVDSSFAIR